MDEPAFGKVAIIGLGLIGGSIAAGLRQQGLAREVTAWDSDTNSLSLGQDLGIIDSVADDIGAATREADLVVLAVPVQSMTGVLSSIELDKQVVTDVGSVKSIALDAAREVFGEIPANFVPGHPIAGSEKHGVVAANPDLFRAHRVILTPTEGCNPEAQALVQSLWQALGAEVVRMTPEHHDDVLAQTSHLPHLLAYALVDTLSSGGDSMEVFQYAAGGFRDFSRIAASDPTMWSDIFNTNAGPILDVLERYQQELGSFRKMIESGDEEKLQEVLTRAKAARDHFTNLQDRNDG